MLVGWGRGEGEEAEGEALGAVDEGLDDLGLRGAEGKERGVTVDRMRGCEKVREK